MIPSLYDKFLRWHCCGSIYIISDTHFDDPQTKEMNPDWPSPEEHIEILKKHITAADTLIHLGDVGNPAYLDRLPGYKVLIMGNHDKKSDVQGHFNEIYDGALFVGRKILLSHEPCTAVGAMNIHGHMHCEELFRDKPFLIDERMYGRMNLVPDVFGFKPLNLGIAIQNGLLSGLDDIHRITINNSILRKKLMENEEALCGNSSVL